MISSKTMVNIILSSEANMEKIEKGIDVTYAETEQGNSDKKNNYGQYYENGMYKLKEATITLYMGSIEWSTTDVGNDNYGLTIDEVIGIEAGHEAVHAVDAVEVNKDKQYEHKYDKTRPDKETKPREVENQIRKETKEIRNIYM